MARKCAILGVLSAPNNTGMLRANISKRSKWQLQCKKLHRNKDIPYQEGSMHAIPHSFGALYFRQTDQFVSGWLWEHSTPLKTTTSAHLTVHVRSCERVLQNLVGLEFYSVPRLPRKRRWGCVGNHNKRLMYWCSVCNISRNGEDASGTRAKIARGQLRKDEGYWKRK